MIMTSELHDRIARLTGQFGRGRVVVLGDLMLDEYWWGSVERISPEAPVPVVLVDRQGMKLGGAANVALNIHCLGGTAVTVGVHGHDRAGEALRVLMTEQSLPTDGLVGVEGRPTTIKTRIVAAKQQVVRADIETTDEIDLHLTERVFERFVAAMNGAAGVIISDYGKGVITRDLLDRVIGWARAHDRFIVVDPKDTHFFSYRKVTTLTPNHHEAGFVAGRRLRDEATLREVGSDLMRRLESDSLLITRGEHGMALFEQGGGLTLIPTVAEHVFDVTGAGDTVIATVAMCLAVGGSLLEAAYTANVAAGQVIREVGTAQTTVDAIRKAMESIPEPVLNHVG